MAIAPEPYLYLRIWYPFNKLSTRDHDPESRTAGMSPAIFRRQAMPSRRKIANGKAATEPPAPAADRAILDRRAFLTGAVKAAGFMAFGALAQGPLAAAQGAEPLTPGTPSWMKMPGQPPRGYGLPAAYEAGVQRIFYQRYKDIAPAAGMSMTPLHQ